MPTASAAGSERHLRVLVADEDKPALAQLGSVLESLGHQVTPYAVSVAEAIEQISTEDPDLAIVVVHRDHEHALTLIGETVEYASGPVIAQARDSDVEFVARAAERGISAWIDSSTRRRSRALSRSRCGATRRWAAAGQGRPARVRTRRDGR